MLLSYLSFNPCSLGCCSERCYQQLYLHCYERVSILVLLDVALKGQRLYLQGRARRVSILVLLDVALKGAWPKVNWLLSLGFNPCSLGCCSESHDRRRAYRREGCCFNPCSLGCCSESCSKTDMYLKQVCFNPCSLGCCSESCYPGSFPRWYPGLVSILVLLDVALKGEWSMMEEVEVPLFQSLFSWMLLWKLIPLFDSYHITHSFNPCSLGCCSERRFFALLYSSTNRFNPCSLGCCSESFSLASRIAVAWSCFNPCSLGCCSERPGHPGSRLINLRFNPCSLGCCSESRRKVCK